MPNNLLSFQDLAEIVGGAATIHERLGDNFIPRDDGFIDSMVDSRIKNWRQTVALGNCDIFLKRLSFDNLDLKALKQVLGPVRLKKGIPLPGWTGVLEETINKSLNFAEKFQTGQMAERFLDNLEPAPFEDILALLVLTARNRLTAMAGDSYSLLSSNAHAALERSLLKKLSYFSAPALFLEFSILRKKELPPAGFLFEKLEEYDCRSVYRIFTGRMLAGGLVYFLKEYAVLARLLAVITSLWVKTSAELITNLVSDLAVIQRVFMSGGSLGEVEQVQPLLQDPHRNNRVVVALTFSSGLKLVYKRKDLSVEEAFYNLLAFLNETGATLPFGPIKLIKRSTHGWVDYIEHLPCKTHEEALRYYTRAGMLLCLVYALKGADCHFKNIIASGESPVLLDMETLLQHKLRTGFEDQADAIFLAYEQIMETVSHSGLLPIWIIPKDRQYAFDISGLGGGEGSLKEPYLEQAWVNINKNNMAPEKYVSREPLQPNIPLHEGNPLRLEDYAEEVITGFRQMYRNLERQRETLLAPGSLLQTFAELKVRFVFRSNRAYTSILKDLRNPKYMRDGADYDIRLEQLARKHIAQSPPAADSGVPLFWPILAAEKLAMKQGDIPYFTAQTSRADLEVAPGQFIKDCFIQPSFERVVTRLKELNSDDLERQTGFIRAALFTHHTCAATDCPQNEAKTAGEQHPDSVVAGLLSPDELFSRAVSIAEELKKTAIYAPDGSAAWIAPQFLTQVQRYQLKPVGFNLYDGACGIALFLAAVEKATGRSGFRELSLAALKPLLQLLQSQEKSRALAVQMGIGGAAGLGSVLYALTRTGQLLGEEELVEQARQAARLITKESIENDRSLDIVFGTAGAILGLLAVHGAGGGPSVLEAAQACGRRLLNSRTLQKTSHVRPTPDGKPLTGFFHGAAGIAYSLLKLYKANGDVQLREAATELINYGRGVFAPDAGNCPDFKGNTHVTSWPHGDPCIGLALLGGLSVFNEEDFRDDINAALQATLRYGLKDLDDACCGNMGRAEVLIEASRRLSRPDLLDAAGELAAQVVFRAERTGGFFLLPGLPGGVCMPGFFQGCSGVGYTLLRLVLPELLPCVLLWE